MRSHKKAQDKMQNGVIATKPTPAIKETDPYLAKFEHFEQAAREPSWLFPLRKAGLARFAELGFPTTRHEDWRFTNVAPIAKLPFKPIFDGGAEGLEIAALDGLIFARLKGTSLVFVNGLFAPGVSTHSALHKGVPAGSLAAALESDAALLEKHQGCY